MSQTIVAPYLLINSEDSEATVDYLNSIEMTFADGLDNKYFHIEVSKEPEILNDLREAGIFKLRGGWSIINMNSL